MASDSTEFDHDKVSALQDASDFDRPQCPISNCRFILEANSPDGYTDLADHEWWCPNHGSLLEDADHVQRRCSHCGGLCDPLPEEYHGEYTTPDGESYYANSGTYMHPQCAEQVIDAVESDRNLTQLADFC